MFYIDFTTPEGKTYRIDVSKNPVLYKCPICGEIFNSVASIVSKNHKEKNAKMLVYRAIVAKYGQEKGLELYRHIKPLL